MRPSPALRPDRVLSPVVFLAAAPYFLAMGSDFRDCGRRFSDIFRIYGFNLLLLPVNLVGRPRRVLKFIQQAFTGGRSRSSARRRTRTAPRHRVSTW